MARIDVEIKLNTTGAAEAKAAIAALKTATGATGAAASSADKAARATQALAASEIRAATAGREYGKALGLVRRELDGATPGTVRYNNLLGQQATLLRQAGQAAQSSKSGLGGLVGTIGGGIAAVAGFSKAVGLMSDGLNLVGTLDASRRTLGTLLGSVERGNQVYADAIKFGERYGFTQQEIASSTAAAALIIKNSTQPTEKILEVLGRLAALNPAEGIDGATVALKELASGDITSIVERFNLSRDAARAMKNEIAAGADPVRTLDKALSDMGVTADILKQRLEGPAGAVREFAAAKEQASIAIGKFVDATIVETGLLGFLSERLALTADTVSRAADGFTYLNDSIKDTINGELDFILAQEALTLGMSTQIDVLLNGSAQTDAYQVATSFATASVVENTNATYEQIFALDEQTKKASAAAIAQQALEFQTSLARDATLSSINAYFAAGNGLANITYNANLAADALAALRLAQAQITGQGLTPTQRAAVINERKYAGENPRDQRATRDAVQQAAQDIANPSGAAARQTNAERAAQDFNRRQSERIRAQEQAARQRQQAAEQAGAAERAYLDQVDKSGQRQRLLNDVRNAAPGTAGYYDAQRALAAFDEDIAARRQKAAKSAETASNKAERAAEAAAKKAAKLTEAEQREAEKLAEDIRKAQFDLLGPTQQLLDLQKQLAANPPELERLQLTKEIRDLQEKIDKDRIDAAKAVLDLEKSQLDDRQARRAEDAQRRDAERIINSSRTTQAQKDAARDRLAEIDLDRRTRAQEIATKRTEAGLPGASLGASRFAQASGAGLGNRLAPQLSGTGSAAGGAATSAGVAPITLNVYLEVDGALLATGTSAANGNLVSGMRLALKAVQAAGTRSGT